MTPHPDPDWHEDSHRTSTLSWRNPYNLASTFRNIPNADLPDGPQTGHLRQNLKTTETQLPDLSVNTQNQSFGTATTNFHFNNEQPLLIDEDERSLNHSQWRLEDTPHFENDIPDLMITDFDDNDREQRAWYRDVQLQTPHTQSDPEADYSAAVFEQHFPYPPSSFLDSSVLNTRRIHSRSEHIHLLESVLAAPPPSPSTPTDSRQIDGELIFDLATGEQQQAESRRSRRRTTKAQSDNRRIIRRLGGACPSCKLKKRQVCWFMVVCWLTSLTYE